MRAPAVNGWLSKHPIFGSVLTPWPEAAAGTLLDDVGLGRSPPRSPSHKGRSGTMSSMRLGEDGDDGESAGTAELLALVRQLVEDSKRREEQATHHATEELVAVAAAASSSAAEAKAAAERCAA